MKEMVSKLYFLQESKIFQELWRHYGIEVQKARESATTQMACIKLSDVQEQVWKPAFKYWGAFVEEVAKGTVKLKDVDKNYRKFWSREEELEREIHTLFKFRQNCNSEEKVRPATVRERVTQIQRYKQLHQCTTAANAIWEFKEAMGFSGDFNVIKDIRCQVSINGLGIISSQKLHSCFTF